MDKHDFAKLLWVMGVMAESAAHAKNHPFKCEPMSQAETDKLVADIGIARERIKQLRSQQRGEMSLAE